MPAVRGAVRNSIRASGLCLGIGFASHLASPRLPADPTSTFCIQAGRTRAPSSFVLVHRLFLTPRVCPSHRVKGQGKPITYGYYAVDRAVPNLSFEILAVMEPRPVPHHSYLVDTPDPTYLTLPNHS